MGPDRTSFPSHTTFSMGFPNSTTLCIKQHGLPLAKGHRAGRMGGQEPMKPMQEPMRPMQEPVKPVREPVKPVQEPVKTMQEPLKPMQEPVKPLQEPVKPMQEPVKPMQEPMKPCCFMHRGVKLPERPFRHSASALTSTLAAFLQDCSTNVK